MRIGYQGDISSNSEAAAKTYFSDEKRDIPKDNLEYIPLLSSKRVFNALLSGEIDIGVAAIKNSIAGEVQETKNALEGVSLTCKDTIKIPIHHCLFTKKGCSIEKCIKVISHPQALRQTQETRAHRFGWLTEYEVGDQAKAAKDLSNGKYPENYAVICRKNAGETVGLTLIAENIEDNPTNETTFGIFSK